MALYLLLASRNYWWPFKAPTHSSPNNPIVTGPNGERFNPATDLKFAFRDPAEPGVNVVFMSRPADAEIWYWLDKAQSARDRLNETITRTARSQGGFFTALPYGKYITERGGAADHYFVLVDYVVRNNDGSPALQISAANYSGRAAGAVVGLNEANPSTAVPIKFLPRFSEQDRKQFDGYGFNATLHEDEHFALEQDPTRRARQLLNDRHPVFNYVAGFVEVQSECKVVTLDGFDVEMPEIQDAPPRPR